MIFYQKLLWNTRSWLNSSTFWVFRPLVFRYVWSKLKLCAKKWNTGSKTQTVEDLSLNRTEINQNKQCALVWSPSSSLISERLLILIDSSSSTKIIIIQESVKFELFYSKTRFDGHSLWQYRLWSFQERDTKLERFLAKKRLKSNEITKLWWLE